MGRERIKILIEFAPSAEEANKIIENEGISAVGEKIAFLKGMFDFTLVGRSDTEEVNDEQRAEMDYYAILDAIISSRY